MKLHPTLMLVGPVEADSGTDSLFGHFPWRIRRVPDCLGFLTLAIQVRPRVIVCERDLADGSWRDILSVTTPLHQAPLVIVTSRLADERLWSEVLNLGGFDVLAKPLDPRETWRSLNLAWEYAGRPKKVCNVLREVAS